MRGHSSYPDDSTGTLTFEEAIEDDDMVKVATECRAVWLLERARA